MLGHYLASSGWTFALTNAGIATAATADSFLNASHLKRTRQDHQLTCVALNSLQQKAYQLAKDDHNRSNFEASL